MNRFMAPLMILLLLIGGRSETVAAPEGNGGWGDLREGTAFQPFASATVDDLLIASTLVRITRVKTAWLAAGIQVTSPLSIFLEEGALTIGIPESAVAPTMLIRAPGPDRGAEPVVVTPGTDLTLSRGDVVSLPSHPSAGDAYVGLSVQEDQGPTQFLAAEAFPYGASLWPNLGDSAEALDLDVGISTAQPPAPAAFQSGRLVIEAGSELPLDIRVPLLFTVETGAMELLSSQGRIEIKRQDVEFEDSPEMVESTATATIDAGDSGFLMPGTTGSIRNGANGPLVLVSVAIIPDSGQQEAATPPS